MNTVIWDYNGTILDDLAISVEIENMMLRERNLKAGYTAEDYRKMFCFPVIDYYYKMGYTFQDETYEDISVEFNQLYDERFSRCTLCEGFLDQIKESKEKGYHNIILSACEHSKLNEQCKMLGIDTYFDEILGIDNIWAGSKVQMAMDWMNQTKIQPEDCIYIGDTIHDLETAKAIGVEKCILVSQGHQSYEILKKANEDTVHSLKEIQL